MASGIPQNIQGRWYLNGTEITRTAAQLNSAGTTALVATATNDNATAGNLGEEKESIILAASAVAINDVTATNLTSLSLEAGDWLVWGNINFAGTAMVNLLAWISSVSAVIPDQAYYNVLNLAGLGTVDFGIDAPMRRFSLASTTTIYLSGYQDGTGAGTMCGGLYAIRIR